MCIRNFWRDMSVSWLNSIINIIIIIYNLCSGKIVCWEHNHKIYWLFNLSTQMMKEKKHIQWKYIKNKSVKTGNGSSPNFSGVILMKRLTWCALTKASLYYLAHISLKVRISVYFVQTMSCKMPNQLPYRIF